MCITKLTKNLTHKNIKKIANRDNSINDNIYINNM